MFDKEKMSLRTRLRLCWDVFTRGKYDARDYRTIREEESWAKCEQMRKELAASTRPRTDTDIDKEWMDQ